MIDPNKSLIIFSHPRSGSHWVQECICTAKQHTFFNLREFFNLVATYEIEDEVLVTYSLYCQRYTMYSCQIPEFRKTNF